MLAPWEQGCEGQPRFAGLGSTDWMSPQFHGRRRSNRAPVSDGSEGTCWPLTPVPASSHHLGKHAALDGAVCSPPPRESGRLIRWEGGRPMDAALGGSARSTYRGARPARFFRTIGILVLLALLGGLLPMGTVLAGPPEDRGPTRAEAGLLAQVIDLDLPDTGLLHESLVVAGISDAGLPIDYRSETPRTCSLAKDELRLKEIGTCTVTASQRGDATYAPAADVSASLEVVAPTATPADPPLVETPGGEQPAKPHDPAKPEQPAKPDRPDQARAARQAGSPCQAGITRPSPSSPPSRTTRPSRRMPPTRGRTVDQTIRPNQSSTWTTPSSLHLRAILGSSASRITPRSLSILSSLSTRRSL